MYQPASRVLAVLLAALMIGPVFSILAPTASAAPAGSQLATDPEGDNPTDGPDTDILRLGVSADGTATNGFVHLYITVKDISAQDQENGYQVQFKGPNAQPTFNIIVQYKADGTFTSAAMFKDTDPLADPTPVTASWTLNDGLGDTIKINVPRASLGATGNNNAAWSAIIAETFPINEEPTSGINVDQTDTPATWTLTASNVAPDAVGAVLVQAHASHIQLSWSAPYNGGASITSYNVYRDGALVGSPTTASFDNTVGIVAGSTYSYEVAAVNTVGEGAKSAPVLATAIDPSVPSAVQSLVATAGDRSVTLSWLAPASDGGASITGYRVFQGTVSGGEAPIPGTPTGLLRTITGLQNGQIYYFRVAAVNSAGDGASGAEVSATPSAGAEPPSFLTVVDPSGRANGEPTLGVDPETGVILYQEGFDTLKVTPPYTGAWADVSYPFNVASADPIGWMDLETGRYWASQLLGECSGMGYTDDLGVTWDISQGCSTGGGVDHQTVGSGPWHEPVPATALYERSVYYCIQGSGVATCGVSMDGGVTFGPGVTITNPALCERIGNMIHGHVRVGPDGTAYVPFNNCGGEQGIVYSTDNGLTWTTYQIPGSTFDWEFDPSVWATEDHIYHGYVGANQHPWVAISNDGSIDAQSTWTFVDLGGAASPYNIQRTAFPALVAGDSDRAAFTFLGTSSTSPTTTEASSAVWYAYTAFTYDGGATWQVIDAAPGNIIQRGGICTGLNCGPHRNMLDFMDTTIGPRGEVVSAIPDGCTSTACAAASGTYAQSRDSRATVMIQKAGKTLFSEFDITITVPDAPVLAASAAAGVVRLAWNAPASGGSPITGYKVLRDGVQIATRTASQLSFNDTSVIDGTPYAYQVRASNSLGDGAVSASVTRTPGVDTHAPEKVLGLGVTSSGNGKVSLLWDAGHDTDGNGFDRYVVKRDGVAIGDVPSTLTAFTDANAQNGRTYSYAVSAVDSANNAGLDSDAVLGKAVRTLTTALVATDPAGDVPNGGSPHVDIRSIGMLWSATDGLRLEWAVADASAAFRRLDFLFTANAQTYKFTYDQGDIRCNLYTTTPAGGADPVANADLYACGADVERNIVFATIPATAMRNVISDTTQFTAVSAATCLLRAPTLTETQPVCLTPLKNDRAPNAGGVTFLASSPVTGGHFTMNDVADATGTEGALMAFTVQGTSPEGDHVTYSSDDLPEGATLDASTGAFSWTPTFAQAGAYAVTFTGDTGAVAASKGADLTIAPGNQPPVLDAIGEQFVDEGAVLAFTASATDPDGGAVTYATSGLAGATIHANTGAFSWTPGFADSGDHTVVITATDSGSAIAQQSVIIHVANVNLAPVLDEIGAKSVAAQTLLAFTVTATDPDGGIVVLSAANVPAGASWDDVTGEFSWTPALADAGAHDVTFVATDGFLNDEEIVTITVAPVNNAPTIDAIADQIGAEGIPLSFTVTGQDVDGGTLMYSAAPLPVGAAIDELTGVFTWTPNYEQAGDYTVTFTVTDGQLSATDDAILTIAVTDRAPVISSVAAQTVTETMAKNVAIVASDPDGDATTLTVQSGPAWATLSGSTLSLAPPAGSVGTHTVTVAATANGLTATRDVVVTVLQKSSLTLVRVGSQTVNTAPNVDATIEATITNTGTAVDEFVFTVKTAGGAGWTVTVPGPETLAPGESKVVSFVVHAPANGVQLTVSLNATSTHNPTVSKVVTWTMRVPITVTITYTDAFVVGDAITGIVTAKYADGSPAIGAVVRVKQTPGTLGANFATQVSGTTDGTGAYAFDFTTNDAQASLVGTHAVLVTVVKGQTVTKASSYEVGLA